MGWLTDANHSAVASVLVTSIYSLSFLNGNTFSSVLHLHGLEKNDWTKNGCVTQVQPNREHLSLPATGNWSEMHL